LAKRLEKPFEPPTTNPMVTLIFGGTGGIGSELARQMAASGETVIVAGRSEEKIASIPKTTGIVGRVVDATRSSEVEDLIRSTVQEHGRLDAVANCIGSLLLKPAHLTTDDEWAETLATNLTTSFVVLRASVRQMTKQRYGSLVLMASAVAERGMVNHEAIAAAKGGVVALARSAGATYARYGVRVNCIAPGLVQTPLTRSITQNEPSLKASVAMHPLGRIGQPAEVAAAIHWFLRPEQSWITGQCLGVDGGLATLQAR
jgi:NAD(P)-dependent dehydrogenase (short-subunit alcohol dehydrogenase family)